MTKKKTDAYEKTPEGFVLPNKENRLQIVGSERSLEGVVEGVIILDEEIEENKYNYHQKWKSKYPEKDFDGEFGKISFVPNPTMRICPGNNGEYVILMLNQSRDRRPQEKKAESQDHCKLCENILKQGLIMAQIDDYFITPNGFPYHPFSSLAINRSQNRAQWNALRPEEIATQSKISILLDQYVFFNSIGAGASIKDHQHFQIVDPTVLKMNRRIVPLPILNPDLTAKEKVNSSADVFRLRNYLVDALIFTGSDGPYKAARAVKMLGDINAAYNVLVNKDEVYVVGRNKARETSICMCRKVGGYEISGVALLGDIEERSGEKNIHIKGAKIFNNMDYDTVRKNIMNASIPLDSIAKHF